MKLTSAMGRKAIPLLLAYLFGALTAIGVFEVRIWQHWQGEAAEQVAQYETTAYNAMQLGQAEAQRVARQKARDDGKRGPAPTIPADLRVTSDWRNPPKPTR